MNEENNHSAGNHAIAVQDVSKHFDGVCPVKNVSFTVDNGEFVTLLGPSGSGKSTLLGLIAGLEKPSEGSIYLQTREITRLGEDDLALLRRKSVGFVFQAFYLIPTLTALENVAFPLYPVHMTAKRRQERAAQLLAKVGLEGRSDHLPAKMSGGERQRVAIARALVNEPSILFCDEPTGNLDSATGKEILEMLTGLNTEQGVTLFMVTHDREIAEISHRSLLMQDGEVTQQ